MSDKTLQPETMPTPTEDNTVQARILKYAQEIGWSLVSRKAAQQRRRAFAQGCDNATSAKTAGLFFTELLDAKVREFNPHYTADAAALPQRLALLRANIQGNRDFVGYLRNQAKFFVPAENRERDLCLIDYDHIERNVYEVTEEFGFDNGQHAIRADIVFLINGIPIVVVECKNASKDAAIALGVEQIRDYHQRTPELFVPQQVFIVTDALGFAYGVTWNTAARHIFDWQPDQLGQLEAKLKRFCDIPHLLGLLKHYILFAEKDEQLTKLILRQHQVSAVEQVVQRALEPQRRRGLVWHTQGSGKTYSLIKAAELLCRAAAADKPTVLLLLDRNELEDQMLKNLAALGVGNIQSATRITVLKRLLKADYRGIIVTTIHKFRDLPANLNRRTNIYVLIDEAHRTTGGDLGNFLMAGLPNATYIGFSGTPIDKTAYGRGTFKTFGCEDDAGYLHKYSIAASIQAGATLPLYYHLAPNELHVPHETLAREFLSLATAAGITDIEQLNRVLQQAVNLKNFLKGTARRNQVAKFVAEHYRDNVEPLGYKAFLVGVDREACAYYKQALDRLLPPDYSQVVYTSNHTDSALLKQFHIDAQTERQIRTRFMQPGQQPKILLVTEKLLTGFDAPLLYAMYLDKPMRDHSLLQAIARVNRPYASPSGETVKPHGLVVDFVGIFDKLEQALAFDSDEVNAIVKDLSLLKTSFAQKMSAAAAYLALIKHNFNDQDIDTLLEYFRAAESRQAFFKQYKALEMLYEIISPDAFLRPFMADYSALAAIYHVVKKAYTRSISVERIFQKKTRDLVQKHIGTRYITPVAVALPLDAANLYSIAERIPDAPTKVINLVKSIAKQAAANRDDPTQIEMAERARKIQQRFEQRQLSTAKALEDLQELLAQHQSHQQQQVATGLDALTYFIYQDLHPTVNNAAPISRRIGQAFTEFPDWRVSQDAQRQLRRQATLALAEGLDNPNQVAAKVARLFSLLNANQSNH